jgi:hypothetical protein
MNQFAPPPPPLDDDNDSVTTVARSAAQQDSAIPQGWKATPANPLPVVKCTGTTSSGQPCTRWSIRGATVCIKHGGQLPAVKKAAAERVETTRLRMFGATPEAFEVLESLLQPGVAEGIRLKAATEILDRAGLKAGQEIAVTVEHVGSPMEDILAQLETISGHKSEEIIEDAEIVEED